MPALAKPRHEAFAQAIFAGLSDPHKYPTNGHAYVASGYRASNERKPTPTGSVSPAEVNASKLLRQTKIIERVRELQADQHARIQPKLDISKERVGKRLDLASRMAERLENPAAIATNELGIAKVFGMITERHEDVSNTLTDAKSMHDIGRALLQGIGYDAPSDADVALAIEANDVLMATLERIRDNALGVSVSQ